MIISNSYTNWGRRFVAREIAPEEQKAESKRIPSVRKKRLADVEGFKSHVKEENESEKHPEHWTDSAHGIPNLQVEVLKMSSPLSER